MNSFLEQYVKGITGLDIEASRAEAAHISNLTVPPGALGKLESLAVQMAGITGEIKPSFEKREVIVMAADHGVCEEGISAFPQEVTTQMIFNFLSGGAAVNVLARQAGAEVVCVDIGVNNDISHPNLVSRKVRFGTANMAKGPAMTREEAESSIETGIRVVEEAVQRGVRIFVTGEMGIGNTTASAAVMCALTNTKPSEAAGRGTGLDDERLKHKITVIEKSLNLNAPDAADPIDVLSKVGGLEIGGLTGVILGAAANRCPVVIDGFISSAAALLARAMSPEAAAFMVASHASHEQGHRLLLQALDLRPGLDLDMRIGEGTGGVLGLTLIDAACRIVSEMATFESAGISGSEAPEQL
ncbi:nicotinate-nucleotide--dimethylbenzimidazole phosphoribosyltransferase [Paenibacillus sp. J23TS9]|uniref:nicotinate-nucleotide--dimethylbenzimidazole phosphoribosyltransferase n=1 Tax=Paenibacillus sp. J23TS9 TaxID=2807193 RepID=UPI001B26B744|nr:nicotinate-nucleotide--dimethylbenzimidazole phosphoribosyltransferase [Paenibacillus sp. J23TS9]GIP29428.1 nicotinate-nucleotide--dimethylbenzimidazole phosphoribosyltransferase [Paenibacillus sp. J23TS9]